MLHPITPDYIHGAVSLEPIDGGLKPWRLPYARLALYPPDVMIGLAEQTAGVRVRLQTDADGVDLHVAPLGGARLFDLVIDNALLQTGMLEAGQETVRFAGLPVGAKVVEIWLPQGAPVVVRGLETRDSALLAPAEDPRPKWLTYGSSITHCHGAHSPARTWPATAARQMNVNLTCLGFSGNCHMEPMLARLIRDLPADLITLKMGINIQGGSTLSERTFKAAAIGFVQLIRERHATTPLGVISPIISPPREDTPNAVGLTLPRMREELADAVARLEEHGDNHLVYCDGLRVSGEALLPYLPDQLHPNGDGYELLGRNVAEVALAQLVGVRV
jgi:hypothetical protein